MIRSPYSVDLMVPPGPEAIDQALEFFSEAVRRRYGTGLKGLFLFGSRARGDFQPFSDVDVAVVLDDAIELVSETTALSEIEYDVFLATGAEIQPWVFPEAEWNDPAHSPSAGLVRAAKRESRAIPR